jgi:hypothetical protein
MLSNFDFTPRAFFVHAENYGTLEVTHDFDWDTEMWHGEVVVQSTL